MFSTIAESWPVSTPVKVAKTIILHCRTNNLPTKEDPKSITNNIINLAKNMKN